MNTVKEMMDWKYKKGKSLEKMFCNEVKILGWCEKNKDVLYADVLYSFLGIYVIGLRTFYPEQFETTEYKIKVKNNNNNAYSNKFILGNWENYKELNELEELQNFIAKYHSIGNLIPIWPGGNIHKGTTSYCYDLPDIYFNRHRKMADALRSLYENSYMDDIMNSEHWNLSYYLRMDINEYKVFLKRIVGIINYRENKLLEFIKNASCN